MSIEFYILGQTYNNVKQNLETELVKLPKQPNIKKN